MAHSRTLLLAIAAASLLTFGVGADAQAQVVAGLQTDYGPSVDGPLREAIDAGIVDAFDQNSRFSYIPANRVRSQLNPVVDRKSTRLNSSHVRISYAVFCLKKKKI